MNGFVKFNFLRFLGFFCLFCLFLSSGFAIKPIIDISETMKSEKISDGKYSLDVTGTLTVENPSSIDRIYEVNIPLKLDSLIGFSKVSQANVTDKFFFEFDSIRAYLINPGESASVNYRIYGIVNYDIKNRTYDNDMTVLEYYSEDFDLSSNAIINVEKVQREGFFYDDDPDRSLVSTPTGNTSRLVVSNVRNPTDFDFYLKELNLYKTQSSDPMFGEGDLIKTFSNFSIDPYGLKEFDFFDPDVNDYSVYWVSSYLVIDTFIKSKIVYIAPISDDSSSSTSGSSSSSSGGGFRPSEPLKSISNILVKKSTDKTIINAGEEFEVTLRIINVGADEINDLLLIDEVPKFHEIKDVSEGVRIINGTRMQFDIDSIEGYDNFIVKYTLKNNEDIKGITYLKPAEVQYENESFFSDGVLIVNDLLPDKRVFIQKNIDYVDEDFAKVTITVKNLGAVALRNVLVSDLIDDNSKIKDISQVFSEKGVWNIKYLQSGEEWEVSYLVERNPKIETLPNLFGVDDSEVFGTLVFSEEVVTVFTEQPKTVEKVGMVVAIGLLIFYLLF